MKVRMNRWVEEGRKESKRKNRRKERKKEGQIDRRKEG